jgi:glycerophosphoryl diester phosphodiesterase
MRSLFLAALSVAAVCGQLVPQRVPFPAGPPYVIGHRGDSGELPEHTLVGYRSAIDKGADFIECDVVMTKDCQLICRHEPDLLGTTDAGTKFPDLIKNYTVDASLAGRGILSSDLTLEQIRTLRAIERLPAQRSNAFNGFIGGVPTLQEYIDVATGYGDRVVGIYPETKHPAWHDSLRLPCTNGTSFSRLVVNALVANNYSGPYNSPAWLAKPAFIQSFETANLKDLKNVTNIPLVQLLGSPASSLIPADAQNRTYGNLTTTAGLDDMATYAAGVGPDRGAFILNVTNNRYYNSTDLVGRVQQRGMQIHPYTTRNEYPYLALNFSGDTYNEYDVLFGQQGIDGAFTDFPNTLHNYLQCRNYLNATRPGQRTILVSADNQGSSVNTTRTLPTDRPWVIARGGASGQLPGYTMPAYQTAIQQGANFISCSIAVTRDQQLLCTSNVNLLNITDAGAKYPTLLRSAALDAGNQTGIFAADLTLAQIKNLTVNQTAGAARDQSFNGRYQLMTLSEVMATARNASRVVGVYITLLQPAYHNRLAASNSTTLQEDLVLNALNATGNGICTASWNQMPVFIASTSETQLRYIRGKAPIPLVQNLGIADTAVLQQGYPVDRLANIATYAAAIGPDKNLLAPNNLLNFTGQPTQLTQRAHKLNMLVFPNVFRNEYEYILYTFGADPHRELDYFFNDIGVDGVITDYPGTAATTIACELANPQGSLMGPMIPRSCPANAFATA